MNKFIFLLSILLSNNPVWASNSDCLPLPARCQSAVANDERNSISCKSQDNGSITSTACVLKCRTEGVIYITQICEKEFRAIGEHNCANEVRQQAIELEKTLNSANEVIRAASGKTSSGKTVDEICHDWGIDSDDGDIDSDDWGIELYE